MAIPASILMPSPGGRLLPLALGLICALPMQAEPALVLTPAVALYGEPFSWKITGLKPGEEVRVKASAWDARRVLWTSEAAYRADGSGTADLSIQPALGGSYTGTDPFGLLWSMQPSGGAKKPAAFREDGVNGWTVNLTASSGSGTTTCTTATFRCVWQRPGDGLVRVPLEQDGLRGFLYHPEKPGRYPGIVLLGGSEGGLFEPRARALASHGFAVLTLAYFGYPGLPEELIEIPLEYFDRAAAWMKAYPRVKADHLGILGGSKGAEAALLVASRNPAFKAVVAMTPTSHVWEGHSFSTFFTPQYAPRSSWSVGGKPLPYLPFTMTAEEKGKYQRGELSTWVPFFQAALAQADPALRDSAAIPVERIRGAVMMISATDDEVWPAGEFSTLVAERLKRARFGFEFRHISLEGGGHASCLPSLITANRGVKLDGEPAGGSPKADAQGGYRSWSETLAFFQRHLKQGSK